MLHGMACGGSYSLRPKKRRAFAVVIAASWSADWPRNFATASRITGKYMGSLRRWAGFG
jgi:hypothetical protein